MSMNNPWRRMWTASSAFLPSAVVLDLPGNMTVAGGGFPQPYKAAQLHLHWGSTSGAPGSEHTVDGHRFAGEVSPHIWGILGRRVRGLPRVAMLSIDQVLPCDEQPLESFILRHPPVHSLG